MPTKPFNSYTDQLLILQSRGLHIEDPAKAEHILRHFNYYRLMAYRFPFQQTADTFISGTSFEDLWKLYQFDRKLRHLVSEACESLEISVKSGWVYELSKQHGAQAYENMSHFSDSRKHTESLHSIDRELDRSHELFINHYRKKYRQQRPPIWAACEIMSFGLLSHFYENTQQARLKKRIAKTYDLNSQVLGSLIKHASYLRNLCAHHSRLWNRSFSMKLSLPQRNPRRIVSALSSGDRMIYNSLVLLTHISTIIHQNEDWKQRLIQHLDTLNRPDHSEMGFPNDWKQLHFWK